MGYTLHDASWEPEEMLTNCKELLDEYLFKKYGQQIQVESPTKIKLDATPTLLVIKPPSSPTESPSPSFSSPSFTLPSPARTQVSKRGRNVRLKVIVDLGEILDRPKRTRRK